MKKHSITKFLLIGIATLFFVFSGNIQALADQTEIPNYRTARNIFWEELYPTGGQTLYCNITAPGRGEGFNIEHVFAASWMKEAAGCLSFSRDDCRDRSERFNHMEADLHNLYPSDSGINTDRNNFSFTIIPGPAVGSCDFEVDQPHRLVEPAPDARGNIARAIFYMSQEYNTVLDPFSNEARTRELLAAWHCSDPVSTEETRRNSVIESLQGTRNSYIDNPKQIDCRNVVNIPSD